MVFANCDMCQVWVILHAGGWVKCVGAVPLVSDVVAIIGNGFMVQYNSAHQ